MSRLDSNASIYEFVYSEISFDYEPVSEFDYEAVDFDYRAIPYDGVEPFEPKSQPEEHTFVMIKPCALRFASEIKKRIQDEGFTILKSRILHVSPEMISEFFFEHYGKSWFPKIVIKLSKSPLMVMVLAKDHAIEDFKELMGPPRVSIARRIAPYSLRAMYGLKGDFATNGIHGSESREKALREIHFFFPQAIPEPLSTTLESMDYYKDQFHFLLIKSLTELYNYKSPDLLMWFTRWMEKKNPEIPKIKVTYPTDIAEEEKEQQIAMLKNKCAIFS